MILLFVENRYATWLLTQIAQRLIGDGHDVHWIVQNPKFIPSHGAAHLIPFPVGPQIAAPHEWEATLSKVAATDRQIIHFGGNPKHYPHYLQKIREVIEIVGPDLVFGEATQFYELITIEVCRRKAVPYMFPVTTGYPKNRISFFAYDTRQPVFGDGSRLADSVAEDMIRQINQRKVVPNYMAVRSSSVSKQARASALDRLRILHSWMGGERFATPSPTRKVLVDMAHARARRSWEALATVTLNVKKPYLLFPLQLQPECAIDVWGWPWRNQSEIIQRAARALQVEGYLLVVKPNPKSKYEISTSMLTAVRSSTNIVALSHRTSMSEAFPRAEGILSVTGTALIEAVFARKKAISIGSLAMAAYPGIETLSVPEEIGAVLRPRSDATTIEAARALLDWLQATSYDGEVFDPFREVEKLQDDSMDKLISAFRAMISQFGARQRAGQPWI
jgi:hypothetical protein